MSTDDSLERWIEVAGFPRYKVSNLGRMIGTKGVVMRPSLDAYGYYLVHLRRDGRTHTRTVHRVVMTSFVGPRPEGMMTRHLNGIKTDCRLVNLEYGTPRQNQLDKRAHGTDHWVNQTHCRRGHEYTPENTYVFAKSGHRQCRICARERNRQRRLKAKQMAA